METNGTGALALPKEASLFGKMAKVMGIINRVPKSGFNSFHKYKYATTDDVADTIREAMAEANLALFADMGEVRQELYEYETDGGKKKNTIRTTIHFQFTFACGDTGATRSSPWIGQVDDNSDKAVSKCATAAEKYFLMKTFIVSAGDEPDSDADKHMEDNPRKVTPPPQKLLEWHEKPDVIYEMVNRAFKNEWVTANGAVGREQLETLIAPQKWSDFPDVKEAGQAIIEAAEKRSRALVATTTPADEPVTPENEPSTEDVRQALNHQPGRSVNPPLPATSSKPDTGKSGSGAVNGVSEISAEQMTQIEVQIANDDIPDAPMNPNFKKRVPTQ
jgi:hypothetical protein